MTDTSTNIISFRCSLGLFNSNYVIGLKVWYGNTLPLLFNNYWDIVMHV